MYFSKINIDKEKGSNALLNPRIIHGALESSKADRYDRILWRLDKLKNDYVLFVVSHKPISTQHIAKQFSKDGETGETISYDKLIEQAKDSTEWSFRLRANPTKKCKGKILPLTDPDEVLKWLERKSRDNGFDLDRNKLYMRNEKVNFEKGNFAAPVTLTTILVEGNLKVTNQDKFKKALKEGIGRGKAYGAGLLSLTGYPVR